MTQTRTQNFWKKFAKSVWEKKPILAKDFESPLREIQAEQIFSMLVRYSDFCRKNKKADGFKLYIEGRLQADEDVLDLLPLKKDKTLLGYHLRMEEIFEDYCLVCDELLQVSQENLNKLNAFTTNLFSYVGFPHRFVEIGLYLGNYRQTPFGVHVDGCGVFSFPVFGKKTFRLWKPEFAQKNPSLDRAHNYAPFKKASETLVASTGDMTYWPSSAWHIAESDGSFSATWSLGVWVDRSHQQLLSEALEPLLKSKLTQFGDQVTTTRTSASIMPESFLQSLSILKNTTEQEWHDTLLRSWLKLSSQYGFKNFPRPDSFKLTLKSQIQLSSNHEILWSNLKSNEKTLYAYHGHLIEDHPSKKIIQLVQDLNSGQICKVADYLKTKNLKFLNELSKAGAFKVVSGK